ncbi:MULTISPECIES: cytochrome c biogenesis CcdA family protein [Ureibacillus]|uniref:cytochrome c biogenesis CcdA family protein n=1 Tax=Ureibacillus TaxID=160795 RepID=UPI0002EE0C81
METDISIFLCFGAGLLTFLSPCVFPLYPVFLSYITGLSIDKIQSNEFRDKKIIFFHTVCFLLGFSVIYLVLGLGSTEGATFIEAWYIQYGNLIRQIGAILIILFGLVI